jgi:hypothetical protein
MLGRRISSFLLWRKCPWGKWHWRWGFCRCINADLEITRRSWTDEGQRLTRTPEAKEHSPP